MSSPSTEEESISPATMSETSDNLSFKDATMDQQIHQLQSEEVETLLERKLIYEKTRVDQLRNDNQRLLSQNIDLCRAIRQQKSEMNNLQSRNEKLEEQVAKLFLTVRSLRERQQENCEKDAELQESLKHKFAVLKDAVTQKDDQIINLENSLYTNIKEIDEKSNILKQINYKYESEKNKNDKIITSLQSEMDLIKNQNDELHKLLHQQNVENDTKSEKNQGQTEEISKLKETEKLYQECVEEMKGNEKELTFWKSHVGTVQKECEKKCYYIYWKRFVDYVVYEHAREQLYDVCNYLKVKYLKLNQNPKREICERQNFKESFKISMFKSLKNVENLDIDELLLCEDTKELTDFLVASKMSQKVQLKVAAQLLPIVENYRMNLQKDINTKIDNFIKKANQKLI